MPVVLAGQRVTASMFSSTVSNLATGSVTNSVTETVIGSLLIPAGPVANQGYVFHIEGTEDNAVAGPTLALRLRFGTTGTTSDLVVASPGTLNCHAAAQTGIPFDFDGWFRVITPGSAGTGFLDTKILSQIVGGSGVNAILYALTQPSVFTPVNWTVPNFLTVTAVWGTASASNTCRTISGSLANLN